MEVEIVLESGYIDPIAEEKHEKKFTLEPPHSLFKESEAVPNVPHVAIQMAD